MKHHELKCWPEFFRNTITGRKTFEYRKNDREFDTGDVLTLREYHPTLQDYTGHWCKVMVTDIYTEMPDLRIGFCIMQIRLLRFGI